MQQMVLEKSGILEKEDYKQYQEYLEKGQLDENGEYIDPDFNKLLEPEEVKPKGTIHITFAKNRYLEINYYAEDSMETPLEMKACYMNPGDVLYAKVIECTNPNSDLYRLSEYRIVEYDAQGKIKSDKIQKVDSDIWKYEIPCDFTGSELSILPVGEYQDRTLKMNVYYTDDEGNKCELSNAGSWSVNNESIDAGTVEINPIESYVLKLEYDTKNYFFVSCNPECFTKDPKNVGFVEFWKADPMGEDVSAEMNYSVELHKFLNLTIEFEKAATVRVNQDATQEVKKGKVWSNKKLQFGDCIIIETEGDCILKDGNFKNLSVTKDPIVNGYRYTLKIVQASDGDTIDELLSVVKKEG